MVLIESSDPSQVAGEWLANGWGACVWAVIGDHDYKRDVLKLANINACSPCSHCPCDRRGVPWFDFSWYAKWCDLVYDFTFELICELLRMSAGLSILSVQPDWMHDKYLGTDKAVFLSSWFLSFVICASCVCCPLWESYASWFLMLLLRVS